MTDWIYLRGDFGEPAASPESKEGVISLAMLFGVIVLRFWQEGAIKLLQIDTRVHIREIGLISEDAHDKKSWAAAMAIAGVMVAGPLGALAGLAAPKKKTVVFSLTLKDGESARTTSESAEGREGKKVVMATSKDNYSKIIANSGLRPYVVTGAGASLREGTDVVQQLERLADLKERGLISEEEFIVAKGKLL